MTSTACAYPYAMVVSCNGAKLVFLTRYDPAAGAYDARAMATHWSEPDWSALYKTKRKLPQSAIVAEWRRPPSMAAIKGAAARCAKIAKGEAE